MFKLYYKLEDLPEDASPALVAAANAHSIDPHNFNADGSNKKKDVAFLWNEETEEILEVDEATGEHEMRIALMVHNMSWSPGPPQ